MLMANKLSLLEEGWAKEDLFIGVAMKQYKLLHSWLKSKREPKLMAD